MPIAKYDEDDQSTQGDKKEETSYEIYRAEGDVLYKRYEYSKAIKSYTQVNSWIQHCMHNNTYMHVCITLH
jgi:hypothetical protein